MNDNIEGIREAMELKSTESLVDILTRRDPEEWRPEVFDIVANVLRDRGVSPPDVVGLGQGAKSQNDEVLPASTSMVTLATFIDQAQAHTCRGVLENAGLKVWISDEELGGFFRMGVGTRVWVRKEDFEAAQTVLDELENSPVTADALPPELAEPPCPSCGSPKVTQSAEMTFEEDSSDLSASSREWKYHCTACGEEWQDEQEERT